MRERKIRIVPEQYRGWWDLEEGGFFRASCRCGWRSETVSGTWDANRHEAEREARAHRESHMRSERREIAQ